jgi:hypothetical protein
VRELSRELSDDFVVLARLDREAALAGGVCKVDRVGIVASTRRSSA